MDGDRCDVYVSHPVEGKHLAFDGRLLHGVPDPDPTGRCDPGERLSLLVNIWLGHRPAGVGRWRPTTTTTAAAAALESRPPEEGGPPYAEDLLLPLQRDPDEAEDFALRRSAHRGGGGRGGAGGAAYSDAREIGIECGPWRIDGARIPADMPRALGLSRVRLGRGDLRARYSE